MMVRKEGHVLRATKIGLGILVLGLLMVTSPGLSTAEEAKPRHIGLIVHRELEPYIGELRLGLARLGYVEGRDLDFVGYAAQGKLDRLPDLTTELLRANPDVIVAVGATGALTVKRATAKVPIVFVVVLDPVATGLAATMQRPGGNVTGITNFDPEQSLKQFELLKVMLPKLSRVEILSDQDIPHPAGGNPLENANIKAASALGLRTQVVRVKGPNPDLEAAFSGMKKENAEALLVLEVPVAITHQKRIAELAAIHRLPTVFPGGWGGAEAGGLISYGTTSLNAMRRVAD
jgi:putative ABC transport system substrate-binding protein